MADRHPIAATLWGAVTWAAVTWAAAAAVVLLATWGLA